MSSLEQIQKYSFLFESVFLRKDLQDAFLAHLKKECNTEPLLFLMEVDGLNNVKDPKSLIEKTKEIVSKYIESNSKYEINISGKHKKNLMDQLKTLWNNNWEGDIYPKHIFKEVYGAILGVLRLDTFPRFVRDDKVMKLYAKYMDDTKIMVPLLSNRYILKDEDFYEPLITMKDMCFLKDMVNDSFNWKLLYCDSKKDDKILCYLSKINYLPQSKLFKKSLIMKWDLVLPYNWKVLYYQSLREDLDKHITRTKPLKYWDYDAYSKMTDLGGSKQTLIQSEGDIQLPFPYSHLRKYLYTMTSEYDKENEILYVYQKPYFDESLRKIDPSKNTVKMKGFTSKKQKEETLKDCYIYTSFEIFVFQKLSESQTRYQQIHITVINEWDISFIIKSIMIMRAKEIRNFCHEGGKNPTKRDDVKNETCRCRVAYDMELPDD